MHKLGISKSGRQVKKATIVCNSSDLRVVVEEAGGEGGGEERRRRRMNERKIDRHKTNFDC